jgi:methylglutaconyl-CoA hydratase
MSELDLRRSDHTLVVTVQRGDDNLFTMDMIERLTTTVTEARDDDSLRFVLIRATGAAFCLGRTRDARSPAGLKAEARRIVGLNEALRASPLTIVAEVQGDAAGFGAGVVAACDVAVAARHARFWFPEVRGGLAPTVVISWLARMVPYKTAFGMVSSGEAIGAEEAVRWGLVTEAVPAEGLRQRVSERIERLAEMSPGALREIKEFFAATRTMDPIAASAASVDALALSALRVAAEST